MNDPTQRDKNVLDLHALRREMHRKIVDKVQATTISPKFAALLDYLLDITPKRTQPEWADLYVREGMVYGRFHSDGQSEREVCTVTDLARNLHGIASSMNLSMMQSNYLLRLPDNLRRE